MARSCVRDGVTLCDFGRPGKPPCHLTTFAGSIKPCAQTGWVVLSPAHGFFNAEERMDTGMAAQTNWNQCGVWRGGRRMLTGGDAPYLFEKDKREIERLNQQHFLLKAACAGHNFFVPVKRPRRILDVASGTGIWGREVAEHFRQATVWNVDKDTAVYEQAKRVIPFPANFRFAPWTYPAPLPFEEGFFDYVHARLLGVVVKAVDWPTMIGGMLRVTRPGGWIGLLEGSLYQTASHTANLLQDAARILLARYGQEPVVGPKLLGWAQEAGMINLKQKHIHVGGRSEKEHDGMIENMCASAVNAAESLIAAGLFTREEMAELLEDLPLELKTVGVTITFYCVYGQKPL